MYNLCIEILKKYTQCKAIIIHTINAIFLFEVLALGLLVYITKLLILSFYEKMVNKLLLSLFT